METQNRVHKKRVNELQGGHLHCRMMENHAYTRKKSRGEVFLHLSFPEIKRLHTHRNTKQKTRKNVETNYKGDGTYPLQYVREIGVHTQNMRRGKYSQNYLSREINPSIQMETQSMPQK